MGTPPWKTLAIGALALVLCALVAATSDGLSWAPSESARTERAEVRSADGSAEERKGDQQPQPGSAEDGEAGTFLSWVPRRDLALALVAALVVGVALAASTRLRLLLRRRRRSGGVSQRTGAGSADAAADEAGPPPELTEAVHAGLDELALGDPRNAIVAAWLRLEGAVESERFERDPADTPTEFVRRVLSAYRLDVDAVDRLAHRYREARFSEHPVSEGHRAEARECLAAVLRDLPAWQR